MRASEITPNTSHDGHIIARPPFGLNERLPVSRTRVCIGLVLLLISFALGIAGSFFPAAKLWLFAAWVLLMMCSFWVLGLHRLRSGRDDPRKLHGH